MARSPASSAPASTISFRGGKGGGSCGAASAGLDAWDQSDLTVMKKNNGT